jgi:hypothetical protein
MDCLVGQIVQITQVCHNTHRRDKAPYEFLFEGRVAKVKGHMIKIVDCRIISQPFSYPHPGTRWFNTMASDFKHIDER